MSGAKFDPDAKFEMHDKTPLTYDELVKAVNDILEQLANMCLVFTRGYEADPDSRESILWVYMADTLAATLFVLGCSTKIGCNRCDDRAREAGLSCALRLNAEFDKAYKKAGFSEGTLPEPPEGSPIN